MKTNTAWKVALVASACLLAAGCDVKPAPVRSDAGHIVRIVTVDQDDPAEMQAVTSLEKARLNYLYRLEVLQGYYDRVGSIDKLRSASKEIANLQDAQWFQWDGIPRVLPPQGEAIDGADERALVEYAVTARRGYRGALSEMKDFYERKGQNLKAAVMERVAERMDFVRTYGYLSEAEIPPADRRPIEVVPEADALFERALKLHRQGKPLPLVTDYGKQRKALGMFLQLVEDHPRSTKIALSAFYIAEIYKEYFNENLRAVRWYERAWQWDPTITKPARFQAAVIWDLRLHEREKALELYKKVLEHEQFNKSNVDFAHNRIRQLTGPQTEP